MGAYGLDLGTFSPFLYAFREREMILDLFEEVCGARLTYSYITIGGVHDDLPAGWVDHCRKFLDYLKPRIDEYHTLLTPNHIFVKRTAGIGILAKDLAIDLRLHRPDAARLARPHGRRSGLGPAPHRAVLRLRDYEFKVDRRRRSTSWPAARGVIGDCWHRFYVRMLEVVESIKIVEQGLEKYATAQGSHRIEPPRHLPAGEGYVETECPRGQMGFYVVGSPAKAPVPLRVRAKSSSFCNLSVTERDLRGCLIADVPAIVGSIDIVMGEIDR